MGVDVLDPGPDVERVVVLLGLLVGVQRLAVAERPLTLAALAARDWWPEGQSAWSVAVLGGVIAHPLERRGARIACRTTLLGAESSA